MTQITVKQLAAAKRTAMNVLPLTNKKAKLLAKIAEMETEIEDLNAQIDAQQGYVKSFAAGLTTEQLLIRNKETKVFEANPAVIEWDDTDRVWVVIAEKGSEQPEDGALPSAEEIAAAEEAAREEEIARLEAEQKAAEEARQAEIRAAKERLSAAAPKAEAPVEPVAETVDPDNDPFA